MIVFSTLSVTTMISRVDAYSSASYQRTLGQLEWWKAAQIVLMLPAFMQGSARSRTPNSTAVAQRRLAAQPPNGVVRITRHRFLVGAFLWAAVHLIGNGDIASFLFFACFALVAAVGTASIDAKRRQFLGPEVWDQFARQTSMRPFSAVIGGRTTMRLADLDWRRRLAGAGASG